MRPPLRPPDDDPTATDVSAPEGGALPTDLLDLVDPLPEVVPVENPFGLSPREFLFVEAFMGAAHFHAAKAYELAGYTVTGASSRANASRMRMRPRVDAAIAARLAARAKAMGIMDGDEALEGISRMGRTDIRKAFPKSHEIQALPDDVADCIKSIRPTKHGYVIEVYDKMHAREIMAKVSGRLKETVKVEHSLEDILARANRSDEGTAA